jgi:fused signal recognition particle receptor
MAFLPKAFDRLKGALKKTAQILNTDVRTLFVPGRQINEEFLTEVEEKLLAADVGVKNAEKIVTEMRDRWRLGKIKNADQCIAIIRDEMLSGWGATSRELNFAPTGHPTVILVAGVNGAGKTTSIGKLTRHLADEGQTVLLAAADTFRAAAREQLAIWADRNKVEIVSQEGGDPAAVSFDAVSAGKARGKDVVIVDTAGRLPTQLHLMEELRKIRRVVTKAQPSAPHEVLLVIDGNTGQNALQQVKAFDKVLQLTGLIVTKLDGTAKGGVLAAIAQEKPVPVYFIGVGEKLEDLETFSAREFALALLA